MRYRIPPMTPADRAIVRIREEMTARNLSQRDLAERLRCSQGRIAKLLNGRVAIRVNDLDELAMAVGLPLAEVIRDRGLEFYAEMTPTEVRMIEQLRRRPHMLQGVLLMLEINGGVGVSPTRKPATPNPNRRKVGRPRHSERRDEA